MFNHPTRAAGAQRRPLSASRKAGFAALLSCAFLFSVAPAAAATNLLGTYWRFHTGDDTRFKDPGVDDSSWSLLRASALWEDQGVASYDGFAWYRQTLRIPSNLRGTAETYEGFLLDLGQIDDSDETYFNGVLVGATGKLPPDYVPAYSEARRYFVPAELVRWDQPNVIAVRVYDGGGGGGLWGGTPAFMVRGPLSHLSIVPAFSRPDRVLIGEDRRTGVEFTNRYRSAVTLQVSMSVNRDDGMRLGTSSSTLEIQSGGTRSVALPVESLGPGFYRASARITAGEDQQDLPLAFAIEPERVETGREDPPDFREFWDRTFGELAQVAPQFTVTRHTVQPFARKTVYLVEMRSLGNVRIRGWLGLPNKPGRFPAILSVPGYSYAFPAHDMYDSDDFVTLSLNIRGHGNSTDDVNPGFQRFMVEGLGSRETYIYRGAYMDCIRAVDFLVSRPEVDASRIAVEGYSQGGALALATAALDRRVAVCVSGVPGYSDYPVWMRLNAGVGSLYSQWLSFNPATSEAQMMRTLAYFDAKNHAPHIRVPTMMAVGLLDTTCPARIGFNAYNRITAPKEWLVYPDADHGLPSEYWRRRFDFIERQFGIIHIARDPQPSIVTRGAQARYSVEVGGPATYRWQRSGPDASTWTDLSDGPGCAGAMSAALVVDTAAATSGERYRCVISRDGIERTSEAGELVVLEPLADVPSRLMNASVRGRAGTGEQTLIMGFVISGAGTKQQLVRGVGPGLRVLGVAAPVADPLLRLYDAAGVQVAENRGWDGAMVLQQLFPALGAFAFEPGAEDAALLVHLSPGAYTAHIVDTGGGVALAETYDADFATGSRLMNVSVRGQVGTGEATLISGFAVRGSAPLRVLVRALGPKLLDAGVADALPDPRVTLYDSTGRRIAEHSGGERAAELAEVASRIGAWPLAAGSRDSALIVTLPAGTYTAHATSVTNSEGVTLLEIYDAN